MKSSNRSIDHILPEQSPASNGKMENRLASQHATAAMLSPKPGHPNIEKVCVTNKIANRTMTELVASTAREE